MREFFSFCQSIESVQRATQAALVRVARSCVTGSRLLSRNRVALTTVPRIAAVFFILIDQAFFASYAVEVRKQRSGRPACFSPRESDGAPDRAVGMQIACWYPRRW